MEFAKPTVTTALDTALDFASRWWFLEMIVGVLVLVGMNFLFKRIVKGIRDRSRPGSSGWKEKIDYILYVPFQILMWILGITLVIEILVHRFSFPFFGHYIDAFRSTGLVVCVVWVFLRGKNVTQKGLLEQEETQVNVDFIRAVGKILSVVMVILAVLVILQVWGLNVGPLMAFGGIGAAAIGFSAKDVLANLVGSVMLHINRPFMAGDFICLPDQSVEGTVEEIGWNLTAIRDRDKRPVYLPNALFSTALVINSTRMTHRHIFEKVCVRYQDFDKISTLVEKIEVALRKHPDIDSKLPVLAVLSSLGSDSLDLLIDVYVSRTRYDDFVLSKHKILCLVYQEVLQAGVEVSSPTLSITGTLTHTP